MSGSDDRYPVVPIPGWYEQLPTTSAPDVELAAANHVTRVCPDFDRILDALGLA